MKNEGVSGLRAGNTRSGQTNVNRTGLRGGPTMT